MQYFRPRNWEKFQHYKNRRPPWIKNETRLLQNQRYRKLSPNSRAVLHGLWLCYAQVGKTLTWDCPDIAGQLGLDSRQVAKALLILLSSDFIELTPKGASKPLVARKQSAILEKEKEKEKETERKTVDDAREIPIPLSLIRDDKQRLFHKTGERVLTCLKSYGELGYLDYGRVQSWLSAGFDPDLDILPTIESVMQRKRDGPPKTLKYFEQAIADAHKTRTTPPPEGRHNGPGNGQNSEPTNTEILLEALANA